MVLLFGSPAIGAGIAVNGVKTDQRGEPLDTLNPDIGAFQTQASTSDSLTTLVGFVTNNLNDSEGGLVLRTGGDLYGTTPKGGANNDGTVFEIAAGSGMITTLASFDGTNGNKPNAAW